MEASTLRLGFLVGTIALIFLLLWKDRENVERAGILFFRRTKKGLNMIDRIAKRFPRFWNVYAWTGVLAAAFSVPAMLYLVYEMAEGVIRTGEPAQGAGIVYPSTESAVSQSPGAIGVPAEYWVISIVILMVVHELSHGIVARLEDFEINSVGVLVLGIIPGAFVEPKGENMLPGGDESQGDSEESHGAWHQGNWISRIKVLSAGSFANYVFAVIFFLLATAATPVLSTPGEIYYTSQDGFPAAEAGMNQGQLLTFNGSEVNNITEFSESASKLKVNETINMETTEGTFDVKATSLNGDGHIGLQFSSFSPAVNWFLSLLMVISFLNLGIGLFNMLPAKPLDGGHIVDALVERFAGEDARVYVNYWSAFVIITIVGVLIFSMLA